MKKINTKPQTKKSAGQVLVIFGISLVVLLLFVGLALDAGSVYVTYGQLKRAVDSAAIAAANEFKRGANSTAMTTTAEEVMSAMNISSSSLNLNLYVCDENDNAVYSSTGTLDGHPDGIRDQYLDTVVPKFYARCPNTEGSNPEAPKKLVWIEATQKAPLYFLSLLGFGTINLETNAISEAAPLDLVIVLDVSESMGSETAGYFNPNTPVTGCNVLNNCEPLQTAKDAAKALVDTMYDKIDSVGIVTYSNVAVAHSILRSDGVTSSFLSDDMTNVKNEIDAINLNDDAPISNLFYDWLLDGSGEQKLNFANPEDRDNDGSDADNDVALYGVDCPFESNYASDPGYLQDRWWSVAEGAPDPYGWGGVPCDRDDVYDAYDWDGNGVWTIEDDQASRDYLSANDPDGIGPFSATLAPLSTCIGCGIRTGANVLKKDGRYGSVWVMVFLTDGQANLSDTPDTNPDIIDASSYPNGFCNGSLGGPANGYWDLDVRCKDFSWTPRYCIDLTSDTCPTAPSGADYTIVNTGVYNPNYSALDYARDMIDEAALKFPNNPSGHNEPPGDDIAVYTIGLGDTGEVSTKLLRYMALIGIEGRRDTKDPCLNSFGLPKPNETWCGQYYYTNDATGLTPIFEDIASRIFTRISQ